MEQKEYLSIKSFGPIKDVKLDNIKPFTFFIGAGVRHRAWLGFTFYSLQV